MHRAHQSARPVALRPLRTTPAFTTSTLPKMHLCNHLIINMLQSQKNQSVEVAGKLFHYFHGVFSKILISKQLQSRVWK